MGNTFASQKIESRHFYSPPSPGKTLPQVLITTPMQKEITHPPDNSFQKSIPPLQNGRWGGGRNYVLILTYFDSFAISYPI